MRIFGWRPHSTSLGAMMHMAQSLVGKTLLYCGMAPPMAPVCSTRWTKYPESARSSAACMPEMPPPMTMTAPTMVLSFAPVAAPARVAGKGR